MLTVPERRIHSNEMAMMQQVENSHPHVRQIYLFRLLLPIRGRLLGNWEGVSGMCRVNWIRSFM